LGIEVEYRGIIQTDPDANAVDEILHKGKLDLHDHPSKINATTSILTFSVLRAVSRRRY
jgi:hypothetical protein